VQVPLDKVQLPSVVEPFLKVTMPVGVPPLEVTLAFNATEAPNAAELGVAVTVVVVEAALTVTLTVPLLALKPVTPP
jgi:hypothetical protein